MHIKALFLTLITFLGFMVFLYLVHTFLQPVTGKLISGILVGVVTLLLIKDN